MYNGSSSEVKSGVVGGGGSGGGGVYGGAEVEALVEDIMGQLNMESDDIVAAAAHMFADDMSMIDALSIHQCRRLCRKMGFQGATGSGAANAMREMLRNAFLHVLSPSSHSSSSSSSSLSSLSSSLSLSSSQSSSLSSSSSSSLSSSSSGDMQRVLDMLNRLNDRAFSSPYTSIMWTLILPLNHRCIKWHFSKNDFPFFDGKS